jgi:nucleoside-diphosphate-sugar epimerase
MSVQTEGTSQFKQRRILCTGASGFIGTHLVEHFLSYPTDLVLNLDIASPKVVSHHEYWRCVDILNKGILEKVFLDFQPTHLIHLAAKSDMEGKSIEDFPANVIGTDNVLSAAKSINSLQRILVVSTQHVRRPGSGPARNDEDFDPYGAYGLSKAMTEQLTRSAKLRCCWTIIRPTAIWGPGNWVLAKGLWRVLGKGLYLHPVNDTVIRSYGYVKNVVHQINAILNASTDKVHESVIYVGDPSIRQIEWVDAFAEAITGKPVRTAPKCALYFMALAGEMAHKVGIPTPLYLSRFYNLITTNPVPTDETAEMFGYGPYSLHQGVQETVSWLKVEGIIKS